MTSIAGACLKPWHQQRRLFVGGGGSVGIFRLIGVARMTDMMLTGRVLSAQEGHQAGVSQYLVGAGEGLAKAMELATRIAGNAPMTNYGVMHVLPRIADQSIQDGMITESLMAAVAGRDADTKERLRNRAAYATASGMCKLNSQAS